ncbi:MAG: phosphate-starvation-inducible PsiE family protein [Ilumatobacteraceae bacterium]|nr:phosphate-starvation-inducible PsiE family protein [Ilumatobacteraceae bacterium]
MNDRSTREQPRRRIEVAFAFAEDVVYVGIAFLLVAAAGVLLLVAGDTLLEIRHGLASNPIVDALDTLLLVFIIVELLAAVRVTVSKREMIAEPFLLVGIIASIKEIVVLSVKAADAIGTGASFDDQLWLIGVLGVVVLLLGVTAFLLRRKEREPAEGAKSSSSVPT